MNDSTSCTRLNSIELSSHLIFISACITIYTRTFNTWHECIRHLKKIEQISYKFSEEAEGIRTNIIPVSD